MWGGGGGRKKKKLTKQTKAKMLTKAHGHNDFRYYESVVYMFNSMHTCM